MVDSQVSALFQPYLRAGERLVWAGRPARGLLFTGQDVFMIPFSIVWLGFVVFWETTAVGSGGGWFFLLWGAMFLGFGLFFFAGRFVVDMWVRSRTVYAITTERGLSLRFLNGQRLLSAPLGGDIALRRGRGDRGTLDFGGGSTWTRMFSGMSRGRQNWAIWIPSLADHVQFLAIDDVMEAYRLATRAP